MLDEPTRGIDIAAKVDIYELIGRMAAEGKAVLIISSELPELFGITDRILVMRRGRLVADLVTSETTQEAVMQLWWGGHLADPSIDRLEACATVDKART